MGISPFGSGPTDRYMFLPDFKSLQSNTLQRNTFNCLLLPGNSPWSTTISTQKTEIVWFDYKLIHFKITSLSCLYILNSVTSDQENNQIASVFLWSSLRHDPALTRILHGTVNMSLLEFSDSFILFWQWNGYHFGMFKTGGFICN